MKVVTSFITHFAGGSTSRTTVGFKFWYTGAPPPIHRSRNKTQTMADNDFTTKKTLKNLKTPLTSRSLSQVTTRIKRCKRLLKYCWRPLQLGGQWQIPFLQCAYAATAAFAWISTEIELVCAVPAWVFPRKTKAIRNVGYQK